MSESGQVLIRKDVREREKINPIKNKTSEINDDNTMETEPLTNSLKRNSLSKRYEYNMNIMNKISQKIFLLIHKRV